MGDYTRFTFDASKAYSGVLQQQGRVSLDADFNESQEIADRRWRSETFDIIGRAVVPISTEHGFEITPDGAGSLLIGQGRAYVDGIQVECRGVQERYDPILGEDLGTAALPFADQPFLYRAEFPSLPEENAGLVYLDVWQREVTVLEDPDLRESALGGPDTTTRMQTAWQVKVLDVGEIEDCDQVDEMPAWSERTAPSTARLSVTAAPGPLEAQPCVLDPQGGYTGLENRLYRVEIHRSGTVGGAPRAEIKWSRDNASLTVAVRAISSEGSKWYLEVEHTGRDQWLRFAESDVVELLDDDVEYALYDKGEGGRLLHVTRVEHASGRVYVGEDLTGVVVAADRYPRLRRWDGAEVAARCDADIALEDGITITFKNDLAATVRAGDYWVFHARTASGKVQELHEAPPRGVLHHFCKLAIVRGGEKLDECRVFWPPERPAESGGCCACTICVGDGEITHGELDGVEGLRQAFRRAKELADAGRDVTICILSGTFPLRETLVVREIVNLTVQGSGMRTNLQTAGAWKALRFESCHQLTVRDLVIQAESPVVESGEGQDGVFCGLEVRDSRNALLERVAVTLSSRQEDVENALIPVGMSAVRFGRCNSPTLRDSIVSVAGVPSPSESRTDHGAVEFIECSAPQAQRCLSFVRLRQDAGEGRAPYACVLLDGGQQGSIAGIGMTMAMMPAAATHVELESASRLPLRLPALIDCVCMATGFGALTGVAARRTPELRVERNLVGVSAGGGLYGIDIEDESDGCVVAGNRVLGFGSTGKLDGALGGIHLGSTCDDGLVRENVIESGAGLGIALGTVSVDGRSGGGLNRVRIERNRIQSMAGSGIGVLGFDEGSEVLPRTDGILISGNRIEGCAKGDAELIREGAKVEFSLLGGIVLAMGSGMRILDNVVEENGWGAESGGGPICGILVVLAEAGTVISRNRVVNNVSLRPGESHDEGSRPAGGIVVVRTRTSPESRAGLVICENEVVTWERMDVASGPALSVSQAQRAGIGPIAVADNHFAAADRGPIVTVTSANDVEFCGNRVFSQPLEGARNAIFIQARRTTFNSNHCECRTDGKLEQHVLIDGRNLEKSSAIANGNHCLEQNRLHRSIELRAPFSVATANVTTSGVAAALPANNIDGVPL